MILDMLVLVPAVISRFMLKNTSNILLAVVNMDVCFLHCKSQFTLVAMASNLKRMASNLEAMAFNLL